MSSTIKSELEKLSQLTPELIEISYRRKLFIPDRTLSLLLEIDTSASPSLTGELVVGAVQFP